MKIVPISKFEYKVFPIYEGEKTIELSDADFQALECRAKCISDDLTAVIDYVKTGSELLQEDIEQKNEEIRIQIYELKAQLATTDYKALKYIEGEISEEDYAETRELRKALRAEINQLEEQIVEV